MEETQEQLLEEIAHLISSDGSKTELSPAVMQYLDKEELIKIRDGLLRKKETTSEDHLEWLQQFKSKS